MLKLLRSLVNERFAIPILIFSLLTVFYTYNVGKIPVTLLDEYFWVGRSYFFDFYIKADWKNPIWQSRESYDQPKLAEFMYGLWLYPTFLAEKKQEGIVSKYTQFLITHGFYDIDDRYLSKYADFKKNYQTIDFDISGTGFNYTREQKSLGLSHQQPAFDKIRDLIYKARMANVYLLAGAVIVAYLISRIFINKSLSLAFVGLYALNPLIIETSLKAHSEALYLLTFNLAVLCMLVYFLHGSRPHKLLFAVVSGLCISTKLSGAMLPLFFLVISLVLDFARSKRLNTKEVFSAFTPILLSLVIFVVLNPITHSNPLSGVINMFNWRASVASQIQTQEFAHTYLKDPLVRLAKIVENFYFSGNAKYYNGIIGLQINYGVYAFILFCLGTAQIIKYTYVKSIKHLILLMLVGLSIFAMANYLVLNWDRYYVHLVLFIVLVQLCGVSYMTKLADSRLNKVPSP